MLILRDFWLEFLLKLGREIQENQNLSDMGFQIIDSRKIIRFYFRAAESGVKTALYGGGGTPGMAVATISPAMLAIDPTTPKASVTPKVEALFIS